MKECNYYRHAYSNEAHDFVKENLTLYQTYNGTIILNDSDNTWFNQRYSYTVRWDIIFYAQLCFATKAEEMTDFVF